MYYFYPNRTCKKLSKLERVGNFYKIIVQTYKFQSLLKVFLFSSTINTVIILT